MKFKIGDRIVLSQDPDYSGVIILTDDKIRNIYYQVKWDSKPIIHINTSWVFIDDIELEIISTRNSKLNTLGI